MAEEFVLLEKGTFLRMKKNGEAKCKDAKKRDDAIAKK